VLEIGLGAGPVALKKKISQIALVKAAKLIGIDVFDTAPLYGSGRSELILGQSKVGISRVITKVGLTTEFSIDKPASIRWGYFSAEEIPIHLESSLNRLRSPSVYGYLLHCFSNEVDLQPQIKTLVSLKKSSKVEAIGFSTDTLLDIPRDYTWADLIEVPVSLIFDVSISESQILIVNGIHRTPNGLTILQEYLMTFPSRSVIALTGSKNIQHIIAFHRWSLAHR